MAQTLSLVDRFVGCLVGSAVGDMVGAPLEGSPAGSAPLHPRPSRYTDDTHMMIAVAQSLLDCGGFNADHMARMLMHQYFREPWRGYGPGPPRIFHALKQGCSYHVAARQVYPEGSYGNGGAMRVAPVGLVCWHSTKRRCEVSAESARITHVHPLGVEAAVLQANAVAQAMVFRRGTAASSFLTAARAHLETQVYLQKVEQVRALLQERPTVQDVVEKLGNGVEGFRSVPTAMYCFLSHQDSFVDAIKQALTLGGDTDTIGAMTGAMAGACHGLKAIPSSWRRPLQSEREGEDHLIALARGLVRLASGAP